MSEHSRNSPEYHAAAEHKRVANADMAVAELEMAREKAATAQPPPPEPPTAADAAQIYSQLAAAVESIHRAGYAHMDIHVGNVWIPDDRRRPVYLLDLGSMDRIGADVMSLDVNTTALQKMRTLIIGGARKGGGRHRTRRQTRGYKSRTRNFKRSK
jgi:tRNA A-37 threonylcarbamoyl transferase component Bud32